MFTQRDRGGAISNKIIAPEDDGILATLDADSSALRNDNTPRAFLHNKLVF